jgi:hypothetical protein
MKINQCLVTILEHTLSWYFRIFYSYDVVYDKIDLISCSNFGIRHVYYFFLSFVLSNFLLRSPIFDTLLDLRVDVIRACNAKQFIHYFSLSLFLSFFSLLLSHLIPRPDIRLHGIETRMMDTNNFP